MTWTWGLLGVAWSARSRRKLAYAHLVHAYACTHTHTHTEYLQGTEYGVGMVGNTTTGFHFFPIIEVDYAKILARDLPPILGFESKWDPTSPYWTDIGYKAAQLPTSVVASLHARCAVLWERFQCRDYARFDFRCDRGKGDGLDGLAGEIKLLEVNPNPGWCWDGKFAYMGKLEGLGYPEVLAMILGAAESRVRAATVEA
jgi:D-alanine-D-alanine ligase